MVEPGFEAIAVEYMRTSNRFLHCNRKLLIETFTSGSLSWLLVTKIAFSRNIQLQNVFLQFIFVLFAYARKMWENSSKNLQPLQIAKKMRLRQNELKPNEKKEEMRDKQRQSVEWEKWCFGVVNQLNQFKIQSKFNQFLCVAENMNNKIVLSRMNVSQLKSIIPVGWHELNNVCVCTMYG